MGGAFINMHKEVRLRNPRLIVGLPDAGYVGLRVVEYLKSKLGADEIGRIESREFSSVPWVSVKDGVLKDLEPLRNRFYCWKNSGTGNDLVIFESEQPAERRYDYVESVLDVAHQIGVKRVYVLGSFGAAGISHLELPPVLGVVNLPHLRPLLLDYGVEPYLEYRGIGTLHTLFLWFAKARDMEALGLWSPMPHYIASLPFPWSSYPRCSERLLEKLVAMEKIPVNMAEMEALAKQTEGEMAKIYDHLYEEAKTESAYPSRDLPAMYPEEGVALISDEEMKRMIRDIEDFFRKKRQ